MPNLAQEGLDLLKQAFLKKIQESPGIQNTEIANHYGIALHEADNHYLQWSICHRLEQDNKIKQGKNFIPPKRPVGGWWPIEQEE
ncbi:MAG: hypothetical protein ACR2PV_06850 [Gammaproteobacteria bacterium]